jgi:ubiquinone/menaquinone biosynthesis C-methylase UbiE
MSELERYLYVAPDFHRATLFTDPALAQMTERHRAELEVPALQPVADVSAELRTRGAAGAVFELSAGLPSERHLQLIDQTLLRSGRRAWIYWPAEQVVECVDDERLRSLRRHLGAVSWMKRLCEPAERTIARWHRVPAALRWIYRGEFPVIRADISTKLDRLSLRAQPVPLDLPAGHDSPSRNGPDHLPGAGLYLRADCWARLSSDDRTTQAATELAAVSERVVCLTPRRDPLLDQTGLQQIVMDPPRLTAGEDAIVVAPAHYWPIVKATCQALHPTYVYERLAAGQSVGAELSQLLRIPYIVEHPGTDAVLREALDGIPPVYSELYAKAEELALRQATVVLVPSSRLKDELVSKGIDAARVLVESGGGGMGTRLFAFLEGQASRVEPTVSIRTGDPYKDQVQKQWDSNPVGSHYARESQPHTLEWFLEVEKHRYDVYAPWMRETMEFGRHAGQAVLEIGGGMGTDLAQFALHGAVVTDVDLSAGHLRLAEENFRLRGLRGRFVHQDAERLPFDDQSFDLVYSNGVLHHTPNTVAVVREIHRVLRPGGRAIVMVYAERSLHYWRNLVWTIGVKQGLLQSVSMGEIMSRSVERSANEAKPLVKVYTRPGLRALFKDFIGIEISQRQLLAEELPRALTWTASLAERLMGWNLIVKANRV